MANPTGTVSANTPTEQLDQGSGSAPLLTQYTGIQVATPNNANAATAGVAVGGIYSTTLDPHILYIRTA